MRSNSSKFLKLILFSIRTPDGLIPGTTDNYSLLYIQYMGHLLPRSAEVTLLWCWDLYMLDKNSTTELGPQSGSFPFVPLLVLQLIF